MANEHTRRDAVSGSGDITADWGPQGLQITDARPRPVWARITGVAGGTNRYSWVQINEADTTLPDWGSGFAMTGSTTVGQWPAYEVTGNGSVATGTKVQIWPSPGGQFWLFFHPTGVTAGITAEEQDGSPSYTSTTTLRFDQDDGFVLSQPAAGVARIDISAASTTVTGVVNTAEQEFAGLKWFTEGARTADELIPDNWVGFYQPTSSHATPTGDVGHRGPTATTIPDLDDVAALALATDPTGGADPIPSLIFDSLSSELSTDGNDVWCLPAPGNAGGTDPGRFVLTGRYAAWYPDDGKVYTGLTGVITIHDENGTDQELTLCGGLVVGWTGPGPDPLP